MLSLLIVLCALGGVQVKAFPSRYKRNYEASYHYIPYEEGVVRLPAGYSPENFPSYQDYIHGYVQTNGYDWPVYYRPPVPSQAIQDPYSNVNGHHKMKAKHTWHFIDQNHVPITQYRDRMHQFESGVEAPNVIEALVKKEVIDGHGAEYDVPIVVEAPTREDNIDHVDPEIPVVVDSLTMKENPINYEYDKNPAVKDSSTKHRGDYEHKYKVSNLDLLTDKQKSSESYEPVKISPSKTYDAFDLPVEVDSLKNKEKPIKEKPVATYDTFDYPFGFNSLNEVDQDYETPVIVEALIRKEQPTFHMGGEYETPVVVEALVRKHPPVYESEKISLTKKEKQDASYDTYEPSKEKPIERSQFISSDEMELPDVVDSLGKKDKPVKVEPVVPYDALNLPDVVDSLNKKNKPVTVEPADSYYMYEPIKEKPVKEKPIKEKPIKEKPIKEKPIKEKPIKEKPVATYDEFDYPFGFNSLNEVDHDHETPIVVEALIRKEQPTFHMEGEYETPVVVEALVRKHPPVYENEKTNTKENKMHPKDSFHPGEESILTEENVENSDKPVVEALSFVHDIESNETPNQEGMTSDETLDFNEPERDSFDETGDHGSGMDFDGSHLSRSFLPVNSNIFSVATNIRDQERRKFKSCVTPKNETGTCLPFQLCSVSTAVSNVDELLRNVCVIDEVFLGVCCPEFPVETVRVDWEQLKPDTDMLSEEESSEISKDCGRLPPMVTDRDPWPWMALLIAKSSNKMFCGGALIAEQYVLTAAHCTVRIRRNQILVRLGSPTSEDHPEPDFEVIEIKRHAGYNPRTMQNDIALLKLSRRVRFGDFRSVVCLAKDEEGIEGLVSESASLLRWRGTPGEIKDVESLSVISNQECQNGMRTAIADSIICTEPRKDETMCNADSGAPLIIAKDDKFEVIGILTWNRNDCDERFPTVFTRVSSFHRWIEKLAS